MNIFPKLLLISIVFTCGFNFSTVSNAATPNDSTKITKLKNGIPVIYRQIEGSPIAHLSVNFKNGLKEFAGIDRVAANMMHMLMPYSTIAKDRKTLDKIKEEHSLGIFCTLLMESSQCGLTVTDDNWKVGLSTIGEIIQQPAFDQKGFKLIKAQYKSSLETTPQDPSSYVNDILNKIYYTPSHPYFSDYKLDLGYLEKVKPTDLKAIHKKTLSSSNMFITVVTSQDHKSLIKDLNNTFGAIKNSKQAYRRVPQPKFDLNQSITFEDRGIPTAYMRAKFNLPGENHPDVPALKLALRVMSEKLMEEIRNKRSLSYSVHSYGINYSIGIGVISVSTSKPEPTIKIIQMVIDEMRNKRLKKSELDEFKPVFKTHFYRKLESHTALANSLSGSFLYYGSAKPFYDFPEKISKITPKDIQIVSQKYFRQFRWASIFQKSKYKPQWAKNFVNAYK